jgi:hypothetical protein
MPRLTPSQTNKADQQRLQLIFASSDLPSYQAAHPTIRNGLTRCLHQYFSTKNRYKSWAETEFDRKALCALRSLAPFGLHR